MSSSTNPSVYGESVVYTAAISSAVSGLPAPTGTVTFSIDGITQTPVAVSSGTAAMTLGSLSAGSHTIAASYSGDAIYSQASSASVNQGVGQASTTTSIASSANPSPIAKSVTFTATVIPVEPGAGTPTGTVTFTIDGTTQAPSTVDSGVATLTVSSLAGGDHTVTAAYSGDSNDTASTSGALTQAVQAATTTTMKASANLSVFGQAVTFTVSVKPVAPGTGTPTGTVTFTIEGTAQTPVSLASGKATLKTNALSVGTHTVTAAYSGDENYLASTSASLTETVNQDDTTVRLSSSADPSAAGRAVTFTALVTPVAPGTGTPDGSVTFTVDGVAQTPVALSAGRATLTLDNLAAGSHTITASYSGSADDSAATSAAFTQTVN